MNPADPYAILDVSPTADDAALRAAYRRAVQRYHPDHNGGSVESARRFEEVQEAYARIREQRGSGSTRARSSSSASSGSATSDPGLDTRLAAMEQELAAAREAQERARRAAREAAQRADPGRASDEELGYVRTDDSFGAILSDAAAGLADTLSAARGPRGDESRSDGGEPLNDRLADVFEDLGARLRGERPTRRDRRDR